MADLLAAGGILTLLADQHAGDKGCWVNFFGRPASTHKVVALLTLTNETPMAVCFCQRGDRPLKYRLGADRTLDPRTMPAELASVPALTAWYTGQLEEIIRRARAVLVGASPLERIAAGEVASGAKRPKIDDPMIIAASRVKVPPVLARSAHACQYAVAP